jgi:pimeloyl-ACP methyl ester carboxylesterase
MSFWESRFGAVCGLLLVVLLVVVGFTGVRVWLVTHPDRSESASFDFGAMLLQVDDVRFRAADGVELAAWLLEGNGTRPPVILCHDLGRSKASLVQHAIKLHAAGYSVLLFDFRGHGDSHGTKSALGLHEKRDVLGALDFLADHAGVEPGRVGVYGVGMGAHAAVLAAADREALRVLVLDGLYPDASGPLARRVFAGWEPGVRHLGFLADGLFAVIAGTRIGHHRAADTLPGLVGRDLLLLASQWDRDQVEATRRMVASIPEQPDVDGNLVVLPATHGDGLYGEHLDRHGEQVLGFFEERLGAPRIAADLRY